MRRSPFDRLAAARGALLPLAAIGVLVCGMWTEPPLAVAAEKVDSVRVGPLDLGANFNTIQVRLDFAGDDNQNASVLVTYWRTLQDSTQADTAFSLVRSSEPRRFCGVIFWLQPNTSYTVRAVVTDSDGGGETRTSSVTTRANPDHGSAGRQIWASPSGSDTNDGFSASSPKQTIRGALAILRPGGQIRLLPGIYYESDTLLAPGRPDSSYSIVGEGNPDSIVLDGSAVNL